MDEKVSVYRIFIFNANEKDPIKYDQDPFIIVIPNFTISVLKDFFFSFYLNKKEKYEEFLDIEIQGICSSIIQHFANEIQKLKYFF